MDSCSQASEGRLRRRYTVEQKRRIVEECLDGSESVSMVARRHDVNANLLFNWRRLYRQGLLEPAGAGGTTPLVAVRLAEAAGGGAGASPAMGLAQEPAPGSLEIALAGGHRLAVRGALEPALLRAALEVLGR
jgi:transposase